MSTPNPYEYLSVLKRQKKIFLLVFFVIFSVSVIFSLRWSNYRAFATVEVKQPEISIDIIETSGLNSATVEAMADLQISRIRQKVLSTNSLVEIINKLNLYPEARKKTPVAYIAESMRKKIRLQLLSTSLANSASARKASITQLSAIAFIISFEYSDPLLTQQTVNELVSRFLDEDLKERRNTAKRTSEFLEAQIKSLSKSLEEQEKKIAEFRAANGDILPDALAFNQQAAAALTTKLQNIENQIISNIGLEGALRSQLAQTDPYSRIIEDGEILTTPSIQLRALKSQYATLMAKYGMQHPDIVKIARQIATLESDINPTGHVARLKAKITDISTKLDALKNTYGNEHPDVISLQRQVDKLENQLNNELKKNIGNSSTKIKRDADNPAYLQIVAQIEATKKQQEALKKQRDELKQRQESYSNAIKENPAVEQQLAVLTRDYENSLVLYRELKARKLAADMNEAIEKDRSGRRLSVINSPELPLKTHPSRIIFILAGFIFSIIGGLASVFAFHIMSRSVIGPSHLESLIGVAPLVTIPNIRTPSEAKRRKITSYIMFCLAFILIIISLIIFTQSVMPLDVLWAVILQHIGL